MRCDLIMNQIYIIDYLFDQIVTVGTRLCLFYTNNKIFENISLPFCRDELQ